VLYSRSPARCGRSISGRNGAKRYDATILRELAALGSVLPDMQSRRFVGVVDNWNRRRDPGRAHLAGACRCTRAPLCAAARRSNLRLRSPRHARWHVPATDGGRRAVAPALRRWLKDWAIEAAIRGQRAREAVADPVARALLAASVRAGRSLTMSYPGSTTPTARCRRARPSMRRVRAGSRSALKTVSATPGCRGGVGYRPSPRDPRRSALFVAPVNARCARSHLGGDPRRPAIAAADAVCTTRPPGL